MTRSLWTDDPSLCIQKMRLWGLRLRTTMLRRFVCFWSVSALKKMSCYEVATHSGREQGSPEPGFDACDCGASFNTAGVLGYLTVLHERAPFIANSPSLCSSTSYLHNEQPVLATPNIAWGTFLHPGLCAVLPGRKYASPHCYAPACVPVIFAWRQAFSNPSLCNPDTLKSLKSEPEPESPQS